MFSNASRLIRYSMHSFMKDRSLQSDHLLFCDSRRSVNTATRARIYAGGACIGTHALFTADRSMLQSSQQTFL